MAGGRRRNDAQGDNHFHGGVRTHGELNHFRARHDDDEAGSRVRCGGNEHAHARHSGLGADLAQVLGGEKADAPNAGAWIRNEHHLAKGAVLREGALRETLHAAVDGAHQRNSLQQLLPIPDELPPDEIRHQESRHEHDKKGHDRAEARQSEAKERLGTVGLRQEQQGLIRELHEEADDPHHGQNRQPYEDAGDQVAPHAARARRGRRHRRFRPADLPLERDFVAAFTALLRTLRVLRLAPALSAAGLVSAALLLSAAFASLVLASAVFSAAFSPGFASAVTSFESAASFFFSGSGSFSARLRLCSLSDLKSVSYHPAPFRRNTGADTSFFSAFFPHDGHFFKGASDTFCMTSL